MNIFRSTVDMHISVVVLPGNERDVDLNLLCVASCSSLKLEKVTSHITYHGSNAP